MSFNVMFDVLYIFIIIFIIYQHRVKTTFPTEFICCFIPVFCQCPLKNISLWFMFLSDIYIDTSLTLLLLSETNLNKVAVESVILAGPVARDNTYNNNKLHLAPHAYGL